MKTLLTTAAIMLVAGTFAMPTSPSEAGKKKGFGKKVEKTLKRDKGKKTGFGAVFRRRSTHDTRRLSDGRGPGFELGFDGHTGGL